MTDPTRLIDEGSELEVELLRAGRKDAMPRESGLVITAALGVAAPIAAAGAFASTAASAATTGGKVVAAKTVLAFAGLGAAGVLSVWAGVELTAPTAEPASPPAPVVTIAAPHKVSRAAPPAEPPALAPLEQAERTPEAPVPRTRPPVASEGDTLSLELEAIDGARSALSRGDAPLALRLLDRYSARFSKPHLRAEATVLRIEALVASGQRDKAVRLGKAFLAKQPNGPYARRIDSLIEKAGASTR